MKKAISILSIFVLFVQINVSVASAALIEVDPQGDFKLNVLSYDNQHYEVTNITQDLQNSDNLKLSLNKNGTETKLTLNSDGFEWTAQVGDVSDEIVEVRRVVEPDKIKIYSNSDGFLLKQNNYTALTSLNLVINKGDKTLSVQTDTGSSYLYVLPYEVATILRQQNTISKIDNNQVELQQSDDGTIFYLAKGKREIKLVKYIDFSVDVVAKLNAENGNIMEVEQPIWLNVLGFMLS